MEIGLGEHANPETHSLSGYNLKFDDLVSRGNGFAIKFIT